MTKMFLYSSVILLLISIVTSPVFCKDFKFDSNMSGDELWRRVDGALSGLRDYTSEFNVDASSRDIHLNVKGKLSCILPDRVKFVLEGLPSFLGEHKEIITDKSIQELIDRKKFSHSIAMTEMIQGEPYYVMKSTALDKKENLQEARFWIHAVNYTSNKVILKYASGGYVRAEQKFEKINGYMLPSYDDISITFPEWRARMIVQFYNFSTNTGLKF